MKNKLFILLQFTARWDQSLLINKGRYQFKVQQRKKCDVQGFLSYRANFQHAQPTGKLAWRVAGKKVIM